MQQATDKFQVNKEDTSTLKKQNIVNKFNYWLTTIGKVLNTSQLANHK
jgi:hypothetical protein